MSATPARNGPSRAALTILRAFGVLWALPVTLPGLVLGLAGLPKGAHVHLRKSDLAIVFQHWPWGPGGAITLGNVILHTGASLDETCITYAQNAGWGDEPAIVLADHERAHVYQYMVLGVLFLPLYLICGGVSARNPFERAADRYARMGQGWWPWGSARD